ncbi:hypothetical protein F2Q68_00033635 [Brassica cretica]|uniref:Uncharacterized protein n=1 Tax=Brassica cretica TaxID=69181 RepID=A0A8S9GYN5_BRACR|nr:hypothetical protein F2Q68_00033635 [Brassica cretica]
MFPVLLCPIASLSSASMSSLPLFLASRFIFELPPIIKDPVCELNKRKDGSLVCCSSSVRFCLTAKFRRVSPPVESGPISP